MPMEVTGINGQTIPDLLDTMNSFISTDGNNISAKRDFLNTSWFNGLLAIALDFPKNILWIRSNNRRTRRADKTSCIKLETYNRLEAWPSEYTEVSDRFTR